MAITRPRVPQISKVRPDGKREFFGITPLEWLLDCGALALLYVFLAVLFAVLLVIAQKIRSSGDTFDRPGSESLL